MSGEVAECSSASPPAAPSTEPKAEKRAYPAPAPIPTQVGAHGIRFDFNDGCRIALPDGRWHVRLRDLDTGNILYETDIGAGRWNDVRLRFDHKNLLWCPRHASTPRQFECTRLITADAVKDIIRRIPSLARRQSPVTVLPHVRAAGARDM